MAPRFLEANALWKLYARRNLFGRLGSCRNQTVRSISSNYPMSCPAKAFLCSRRTGP
jgi:hypothetical protein